MSTGDHPNTYRFDPHYYPGVYPHGPLDELAELRAEVVSLRSDLTELKRLLTQRDGQMLGPKSLR